MLAAWAALLAIRLLAFLKEIRDFQWDLAQQQRDLERHEDLIRDLLAAAEDDLPEIPEPVRRELLQLLDLELSAAVTAHGRENLERVERIKGCTSGGAAGSSSSAPLNTV